MGVLPTFDLQVRQGLLKILHSGVGDLRGLYIEKCELGQTLQMHQSSICDPSAREVEFRQVD